MAAAKSGNDELVHWLTDECSATHIHMSVSFYQIMHDISVFRLELGYKWHSLTDWHNRPSRFWLVY